MARRLTGWMSLAALWAALAAAAPAPIAAPPPDLAALLPFAEAPLDKPALAADVPLPPVPADMPPLPPLAVVPPAADKPIAFLAPPRKLPCVGAWLGIASESLECGRSRFGKGELDDAAKALEQAVRGGSDPDLLHEARYWLGETYYRLGRIERADWLFRQVGRDSPRAEWGVWALHSSGWTALRVGDFARARDTFTSVLAGPSPAPLDGWARHGLALALYALGRYTDAEQVWALLEQRAPAAIARDVALWHGDTLGRLGQYTRAEETLRRFTDGGEHPLLDAGLLHLGWWTLATGKARESADVFRRALARLSTPPARDWAEAGRGLALMTAGDWAEARAAVQDLVARRSKLALPMQLKLLRAAIDVPNADAEALMQELLAASLTPPMRAWVLLTKGEVERVRGNADDARTQLDLARRVEPGSATAWQATYRLARVNYELREFQQSVADLASLLAARVDPDVRAAALLLQGEAAYAAGDYATSAAAFRRALSEGSSSTHAPAARLGLGWALLRAGKSDEARRAFLDFARVTPGAPHVGDALLLASELALGAGDLASARPLVEQVIASYPSASATDFARLNRGLLLLRAGDAAEARAAITEWLNRAAFPALLGRAHCALGAAALDLGKPDEAAAEFARARKDGMGALATLGFGAVALAQRRLDDAAKAFQDVRAAGTPDVVLQAEYGLAVVAYERGAIADFKKPALAALDAARSRPRRAAQLLYALAGVALDDKDWSGALAYARRLATDYPQSDVAPAALVRVGDAAAAAPAWPVAYDAYALLRQKFPQSPLAGEARVKAAQAAIETGRVATGKRDLEAFLASSPNDPRAPQALLALARARELSGDRAGALDAYSRAARAVPRAQWSKEALFGDARLLTQDKRYDEARGLLQTVLQQQDRAVAVDAARALGDVDLAAGDTLAAAEYYLSAAYLGPDSDAGRRAFLEAAKAFTALKDVESAAKIYKKLLAQADLPPDIAGAARQGLAALGQRP